MSAEAPIVLVVNPQAAAGRAGARIPEVQSALRQAGVDFVTEPTQGPRDATRIVRGALAEGARGIIVVGGDGTLSEALNGFFGEDGTRIETEAWLGPLPCGTGGDFGRTLGIRGLQKNLGGAVAQMLNAAPRPIDCGWLTYHDPAGTPMSRAFLNIASFGVAGLVDQMVNEGPKWMGGQPAFLLSTVRAVLRYRPQRVRLRVDDSEPTETDITNIAVCNGRYFGGGMQIAPEARLDDGLFDVVTVEARPFFTQALLLRHLYGGTVLDQPGIRHRRGARIVAESVGDQDDVLLDVDGETPGRLPATFEMRAGAIRLRA